MNLTKRPSFNVSMKTCYNHLPFSSNPNLDSSKDLNTVCPSDCYSPKEPNAFDIPQITINHLKLS